MISDSLAPFVRRIVASPLGDSVASAARAMRDERVGCVVVTRGEHVIGILTDRDIVLRVVAEGLDSERTRVEEVMTPDPFWLQDSETVQAAARRMQEHGIRKLPIVDGQGRWLGIVTADDLVAELGEQIAAVGGAISEPADADDSR